MFYNGGKVISFGEKVPELQNFKNFRSGETNACGLSAPAKLLCGEDTWRQTARRRGRRQMRRVKTMREKQVMDGHVSKWKMKAINSLFNTLSDLQQRRLIWILALICHTKAVISCTRQHRQAAPLSGNRPQQTHGSGWVPFFWRHGAPDRWFDQIRKFYMSCFNSITLFDDITLL